MAARRHAVGSSCFARSSGARGHSHQMAARLGVCHCRGAQCHCGRGPAPGAPGMARPLVVVAWGGALAGAASMLGFVIATKLTTAANAIFLVYRAAVCGAAEPLGAPRADPPWGLANPPARPGGAGLFLCGAVDLGGVGQSVRPGEWTGHGVARGVLTQGHGGAAAHPRARQSPGGPRGAPVPGGGHAGSCALGTPPRRGRGATRDLDRPLREAMPHVRAIEAIMIPSIEPVLNPLWGWPGGWALVGGTIVVGAARGLTLVWHRPREDVAPPHAA